MLRILLAIITFPLHFAEVEDFLELQPGDAHLMLRGLHSLLDMEDSETIKVHHASLLDFLRDVRRSGEFCISTSQHKLDLAHSVLRLFSREQHQIRDIPWYVQQYITLILLTMPYTCRPIIINGLTCITSSLPVADIVPLVRGLNPHFLWCCRIPLQYHKHEDPLSQQSIEPQMRNFVEWLKVCLPSLLILLHQV
jgi:hypothetical protein